MPGDDDDESSWGVGESDTRARKAAGAARDPRALEVARVYAGVRATARGALEIAVNRHRHTRARPHEAVRTTN